MKKNTQIIIGRKNEQRILNSLMRTKRAEFIAIYGRRRVGKTYLIKNFQYPKASVFFHVTGVQKGTYREQLDEFATQISVSFYNGATIATPTSWKDAFKELNLAMNNLPKNKHIILFFDELPWMVTPKSNLLKNLELFWNRYWNFDSRIKLIICGSATSWIIDKIIHNKGGLHNRVTRSILIRPFTLSETKEFLSHNNIKLNHRQILDFYIFLGGVPLYWTFIERGRSACQSIDELCFQADGPLVKEFDKLFDSLFEDPQPYTDLIRTIAKNQYGIGKTLLVKKSNQPEGGSTTKRLKELEEAGFITSWIPYGHKEKGIYYQINDEYCLFYLKWIEPNKNTITKNSIEGGFWLSQSKSPSWKCWAGYAFETICHKHVDKIRKALKLDPGTTIGTWRYIPRTKSEEDGAQIDLLFDSPDGVINICEIKYSNTSFSIDKSYAKDLERKVSVFRKQTRTKKQLFLSFVTTFGLKPTMYSEEMVVNEVVLDDLF